MAAGQMMSGGAVLHSDTYEVMEEVYDENFEPTENGKWKRRGGLINYWVATATNKQNGVFI